MVNRTIHLGKTPLVPTFSGAGDIAALATPYAWYGLRAFSAAKAAAAPYACIDLRDAGSSHTATINILATGRLDEAALNTFIVANGTAYVTKWYDQSGNARDLTGAVVPPSMQQNFFGTYSSMFFDVGISSQLISAANFTISQPFSISAVVRPTGSGLNKYFGTAANNVFAGFRYSANAPIIGSAFEVTGSTVTVNAKHAIQALYSGTGSQIYIDGSSTAALNAGTVGISAEQIGVGQIPGSSVYDGHMPEFGIWTGDKSASFASLESNQRGATYGWNF